jgi:hypothetical protein
VLDATVSDRWLYGWAVGDAAAGAASLLVPLYVLALGGSALVVLVGLGFAIASGRGDSAGAAAGGGPSVDTDD